MKNLRIKALSLALAIVALLIPACKTGKDYVLTEKNFFLVLTNMWYYPTQYLGSTIVIGFILNYDGDIPAPKNQSEDTNDKSWIHIVGGLKSDQFVEIEINAYNDDGSIDQSKTEKINMLAFDVRSLAEIEDASGLNYYVTK